MLISAPFHLEKVRGLTVIKAKIRKFLMEGYQGIVVGEKIGCWLIFCLFLPQKLKIKIEKWLVKVLSTF